jgi:hypothetical protein
MSDYLGALVDRTLGLAPAVQPRLRALFEPPAQDAAAPPQAQLPENAPPPVPLPETEPLAERSLVRPAAEKTERSSKVTDETPPPDEELLVPRDPPAKSKPAGQPMPMTSPREPALRSTAPSVEPDSRLGERQQQPEAIVRQNGVSESHALPLAEAPAGSAPELRTPGVPTMREKTKRPDAARGREFWPREPRPRPNDAPRSDLREERADASPSAPPPAIHVTIGRVEVRAVLEQKGGTRRASAAPRESLEEYLHARQRGKTRP